MRTDPVIRLDAEFAPGSVLEIVRAFLERLASRDVAAAASFLDRDVLVFGTGPDELMVGVGAATAGFERDAAQMPPVVEFHCKSVETREHGDTSVVQFLAVPRFRYGDEVVTLEALRWSATLIRSAGTWRFVALHLSAPMRGQAEGRSVPALEELLEEKRTLDRMIAERTRALAEERQRVEELLKRELAHQVAERSRELGAALAQMHGALAAAPLPASRFADRYDVVRPLGEGGMGAVYEVERDTDKQRLALKVMRGLVSSEQAARFAREAEIGARVRHPKLVPIVDVGIADGGAPFLVMELVTGGSLEEQRHHFGEVDWARPILRDIAEALLALHQAGVVHRDLKPANVLLDPSGGARVGDFGIARYGEMRPTDVDPSAPTVGSAHAITRTGAWIGTPAYTAPEAARGARETRPAADVFSFGIMAYELITGEAPFPVPAVFLAMAQPAVAAPALIARAAPRVREVIAASLDFDPERRPTAAELVAVFAEHRGAARGSDA